MAGKRKAETNKSSEISENNDARRSLRVKKNEPVKPSTSKKSEDNENNSDTEDIVECSESEEVVETESKKAKKSNDDVTPKRGKNAAQKIECIAIKYDIPDTNHPNHMFHNKIDRIPISEIIGFNVKLFKRDVRLK